jgi:hypothetical protein
MDDITRRICMLVIGGLCGVLVCAITVQTLFGVEASPFLVGSLATTLGALLALIPPRTGDR